MFHQDQLRTDPRQRWMLDQNSAPGGIRTRMEPDPVWGSELIWNPDSDIDNLIQADPGHVGPAPDLGLQATSALTWEKSGVAKGPDETVLATDLEPQSAGPGHSSQERGVVGLQGLGSAASCTDAASPLLPTPPPPPSAPDSRNYLNSVASAINPTQCPLTRAAICVPPHSFQAHPGCRHSEGDACFLASFPWISGV